MLVIECRNVNDAWPKGLTLLKKDGHYRESRNGRVLRMHNPVTTKYEYPWERVLFCPIRDANPFFHLMEALWMMGGRQDVEFVKFYNKRMEEYSDDGRKFHAAYGHRWRKHFHEDQVHRCITILRNNMDDRRAVIAAWDPHVDLGHQGVDVPCNTHIYFDVDENVLNMTVCNRSNDIVWGAYGANVVHMSILQEYMASCLGISPGHYWQVSNNFHAYTEILSKYASVTEPMYPYYHPDPYITYNPFYYPIVQDPVTWMHDNQEFLKKPENPENILENSFFTDVAVPMHLAFVAHRVEKNQDKALSLANSIAALDWHKACTDWLLRRYNGDT